MTITRPKAWQLAAERRRAMRRRGEPSVLYWLAVFAIISLMTTALAFAIAPVVGP